MSRKRNEDTIISNPLASREESFRFLSSIFTPQIEPEVISMVIEAYDYDVERSMDELMVMSSQASADVIIEELAVKDSAALPSTDKFSLENQNSVESNVAESHGNVDLLSKCKIQPCSVTSEAAKSVKEAKVSQKNFQLNSTACFSEKNLPGVKIYSQSDKLEKSVGNDHLISYSTQKDKKLYSKAAILSKDHKSSAEKKIGCVDDGLGEQTKELKTIKSSQICYSPNRNPIFNECNYSFPDNGVHIKTKSKSFTDEERHSPLKNSTDRCQHKKINTALDIKFAPANGIFWSSSEEKCTMTQFNSDIETKKQIKNQLRKKTRILIILRGLPGSGKSTLARKLVFNGAVFNTDDYFIKNGVYCFIKSYVGEAHAWNQSRAKNAMAMGVSPVIIDNTNVMFWEMDPYISWGRKKKYDIIVLEPCTWWKFKTNELAIRNSHGVPKEKIREMLERYETIHPNSFAKHEIILTNKCDSFKDTVANSDGQKKILEDKNNYHQYLSDPSVKKGNPVCIKQKVLKTADSKTSDVKILSPTLSKKRNSINSEIISDLEIYNTLTWSEKCSGDATSSIKCTSKNKIQTSEQDKYHETKSLISGDSNSCGFVSLDAQTYEAFDTTAMIFPNMQSDLKVDSIDIGAKDMNVNIPFWQNEYDGVQKLSSSEGINSSNTLIFPYEIKPIECGTSIKAIIYNEENFVNNQPSKLELKTTIDPNPRLIVPNREMEEKLMNVEILQNISSFGVKHDLCTESSKFNIKMNAENKNLIDKCLVSTDEEFESKNENSHSFKIDESQSIKKSHCFSDKNKDLKFEISNSIQNKLDTESKEKKISENCFESQIINDSVNNLKENLKREFFFVSSDDQDSEFETIDIPESNTNEDLSKINFCSLLSIDNGINDLCNSLDKNLINDSNVNNTLEAVIDENDDCISSYHFQDNILSWNEITEHDDNFHWKNMSENDQYVSENEVLLDIAEKSSTSKDLRCIKKSSNCKINTSELTNIFQNENRFLESDAHQTANRLCLLAKENDSSTKVSSSSEYNLDSQSSVSSVSEHNPDSQSSITSASEHNLDIRSPVSSASDSNLNNSNPKPQRLGLQKISISDKCSNFSVCNSSEEDQDQLFETGDWDQETDFKNVDKPELDNTHQQPKPPRNFSKITKNNCSNNELRKFDAEIKSRLFANIFDCLKSQYTDSLNWLLSPISNSKFSFYNNFEEVMDIIAQKIEAFSCSDDFEKLRHFLADSTDQSETVNSNIKLLARSILSDVFPSSICSSTSIESLLSDKFLTIDNKSVTNVGTQKESPSVFNANETRDKYSENIKVSSKCEENDHTLVGKRQENLNKLFFECPSNLHTATCKAKESIPLKSKNKLRKIKIENLCIKNLEQTPSVDSPSTHNSDTDSTNLGKLKELIVKKSEAIINNSSDNMVSPNLIELTNEEENIPKQQQTTILKHQKELDLYLSEENNNAGANSKNSENCILYPSNLKSNLSLLSNNAISESLVIENTGRHCKNNRDDIQTADLELQESEVSHSPHPCNKLLDQDSSVKNNLKDDSQFADLKHLFPHVSNDDLEHILEMCHGDKTWATNILLDSNHVKLDCLPVKLAVTEQENSIEEDSRKSWLQKDMQVPLPDIVKSREIASQNQPTIFQPEKLFFTLDPILALQLEELFGPIKRSQSEDDRIVEIDYDFMKSLYTQWKQTLQCRNKESAVQPITSLSHANKSDALAQLIPPKPKEPRNLNEIMENEVELQSYKIKKLKQDKSLSIMKSRLQLYKAYPGAEPTVLDSIFDNNNHNLTDTLKILGAPVSGLEEACNSAPLVPSHSESASKIALQSEFEGNSWHSWVPEFELQTQFSTISDAAIALRKEAMHQYTLSKKSLEKAKRYFQEGNEMAGSYYTAESKRFKIKFKALNKEASQLISQERNDGMRRLQLDLHGLYVSEALPLLTERLKELLKEPKTSWTTFKVITGQGKHSERGPKLHFSVMEFLKKNGHEFTVLNAGTVDVLLPPKER